jgi:uncharacterized protein with PQ loop repeat
MVGFAIGLVLTGNFKQFFVPDTIIQIILAIIIFGSLILFLIYFLITIIIRRAKYIFANKPTIIMNLDGIQILKSSTKKYLSIKWTDISKVSMERWNRVGRNGGQSMNKYITFWTKLTDVEVSKNYINARSAPLIRSFGIDDNKIFLMPNMYSIKKSEFIEILKDFPVKIEI